MTNLAHEFEIKEDGDNVPADVAEALSKLSTGVNDRLKAMETKSADAAKLADRLSAIETRLNRPTGLETKSAENDNEALELKALASLVRDGNETEIKAAASDSDPSGGYFVLPTVDTRIRTLLKDMSPLRSLAEVVSISGGSYERFYSKGKRGAVRVTERGERAAEDARPELVKHSYGVGEYYANPTTTRQMLDDSSMDVAAWLLDNAIQDFAETESEDFLTGDGLDGFPRGLLTYPTAPEKDFVRAWGKFQYVPTESTGPTPSDDDLTRSLVRLMAALRRPYKQNACFVMNSNTAVRLRTIKDGDGRYMWAPTGNLIEGIEHPLHGRRVEIDEGMPDIGANAHPIAFGDFRQGYVIVDRHGIRTAQDTITQKGRVIIDTYKRVGGGAGDFNAIKFLKVAAS